MICFLMSVSDLFSFSEVLENVLSTYACYSTYTIICKSTMYTHIYDLTPFDIIFNEFVMECGNAQSCVRVSAPFFLFPKALEKV